MTRPLSWLALIPPLALAPARAATDLRVSPDGHYFTRADGSPWFWQGEYVLYMVQDFPDSEVDTYLAHRKDQGFTIASVFCFAPHNPDGVAPWADGVAGRPNEPYFRHIDHIVAKAGELGLHILLDLSFHENGVTDTATARSLGAWMGARYGRLPQALFSIAHVYQGQDQDLMRAAAEGVVRGATGRAPRYDQKDPAWDSVMITIQGKTGMSSSQWFHQEPWLRFNTHASFQAKGASFDLAYHDYSLPGPKPAVNDQPQHPGETDPGETRRMAFQTYLGGGFTDAWEAQDELAACARWWKARKWWRFAPAPGALSGDNPAGLARAVAARSRDGDGLVAFFGSRVTLRLHTDSLPAGKRFQATWHRLPDGATVPAGVVAAPDSAAFIPPEGWSDGVLELAPASGTGLAPGKVAGAGAAKRNPGRFRVSDGLGRAGRGAVRLPVFPFSRPRPGP